jgi:hypothetical protein
MWRPGPLREDKRRRNGKPLRKSVALKFVKTLESSISNETPCIYEACFSCVVTGYNDLVYTVCAAVDTYFDEDNADKLYDADDEMMDRDPILAGLTHQYDAAKPTRNPRKYFLMALASRLENATKEWEKTIGSFRNVLEKYVSSCDSFRSI